MEGRGLEIAEALFRQPAEVETPEFTEFADTPPALLGQFRDSFIVAADQEGVWLVDQHAAHERVLYEELLERQTDERPPQQILLTPLHLELTPAERVTMEEEISKFASFGFDIESFGGGGFVIRAVPAAIKNLDPLKLVKQTLSEQEQECPTSTLADAQGRVAARLACHAAIKIHNPLGPEKMRYLLARLWAAKQPTVCPHGRPTTLRISLTQMEKRFGRI